MQALRMASLNWPDAAAPLGILRAVTVLVGGAMAADVAELRSRTASVEQIVRTVE